MNSEIFTSIKYIVDQADYGLANARAGMGRGNKINEGFAVKDSIKNLL